jgi:tetratricopeptide (TPR) repeat protein
MFRDFPLLGVGGGAFRDVFPAYQPERFGDRAARYLHNDWLQVACETGVLGAAVAYAGIGVFLAALLRSIRRRQDPYCRLIFAGAFAGVVAMLLHSLVDFNLYLITANGLVFTVLLGICHTAAHMQGRSRDSEAAFPVRAVEIRGAGLRVGLPALVIAACLVGSILPIRSGLADVAFNRYQARPGGKPTTSFFWECSRRDEDKARQALARALELQPGSPVYNFSQGLALMNSIREKILSAARDRARALLLGEPFVRSPEDTVQALAWDISQAVKQAEPRLDEDSEEFQSVVLALTEPAQRQMQDEILADLSEAERFHWKAMRIAPTVPWVRMSLAMAYADLLGPGPALEAERAMVDGLVEEALALAPNRPANLFLAGRYYARAILAETGGLDLGRARDKQVLAMLEKALQARTGSYAHPTYEFLMDEARVDPGMLFQITPEEISHQRWLQWFFHKRGLWSEALRATENVLALLGIDPRGSKLPATDPDLHEFRLCRLTTLQQTRILRRLGMLEPWSIVKERYRAFLRVECSGSLEEASRYARLGRLAEARKACTDCLEQDWNNLDAFLALAEIELLPGASRAKVSRAELLGGLLRQAHANPAPGRENCERLTEILRQLAPETPTEHLQARLIEAIKLRGCGDPQEASRILKALLVVDAKPFVYWHQRHLLHYHLGRSLEMSGTHGEAVSEYEKALGLAPAHRPSLERLVALGQGDVAPAEPEDSPTVGEKLLALTPELAWNIDLAGRVRLLGITLEGGEGLGDDLEGPASQPGFTARYLWEVSDDLDPTDYYVAYRYFDADGSLVYRGWKTLYPDPKAFGQNLDGGVGTVLVHWDYLPFPRELAREARILVGQRRKGKAAPPPLRSITGDRWLALGLP